MQFYTFSKSYILFLLKFDLLYKNLIYIKKNKISISNNKIDSIKNIEYNNLKIWTLNFFFLYLTKSNFENLNFQNKNLDNFFLSNIHLNIWTYQFTFPIKNTNFIFFINEVLLLNLQIHSIPPNNIIIHTIKLEYSVNGQRICFGCKRL